MATAQSSVVKINIHQLLNHIQSCANGNLAPEGQKISTITAIYPHQMQAFVIIWQIQQPIFGAESVYNTTTHDTIDFIKSQRDNL